MRTYFSELTRTRNSFHTDNAYLYSLLHHIKYFAIIKIHPHTQKSLQHYQVLKPIQTPHLYTYS